MYQDRLRQMQRSQEEIRKPDNYFDTLNKSPDAIEKLKSKDATLSE